MTRAIAPALAAGIAWLAACGSNSLVLGGDPELGAVVGEGGSLGTAGSLGAGGSLPTGSGGAAGASPGIPRSDPYPWVAWAQGTGHATHCASFEGRTDFTCVSYDLEANDGSASSCESDGEPYCNACSCWVPCTVGAECPPPTSSGPVDCIGATGENPGSCFATCDDGEGCPTGMRCTDYPGTARRVCLWVVDDSDVGQPAPR